MTYGSFVTFVYFSFSFNFRSQNLSFASRELFKGILLGEIIITVKPFACARVIGVFFGV